MQISPLFTVVAQLRERELKLLREFGMTPASRTKVQIVQEDDGEAELAAILSRPRTPRFQMPESFQ